jgi:predicted Mrr-cat superfamily restriction endonuclease
LEVIVMARWVIALLYYDSQNPEPWETVWRYDHEQGIISIGWGELGDISSLSEDNVRKRIDKVYPHYTASVATTVTRMLYKFFHEVKPGHTIVARRGRKMIAATGTVNRPGYYDRKRNPHARNDRGVVYPNHLDVEWQTPPRRTSFDSQVFGILTIYELPEQKFRQLMKKHGGG